MAERNKWDVTELSQKVSKFVTTSPELIRKYGYISKNTKPFAHLNDNDIGITKHGLDKLQEVVLPLYKMMNTVQLPTRVILKYIPDKVGPQLNIVSVALMCAMHTGAPLDLGLGYTIRGDTLTTMRKIYKFVHPERKTLTEEGKQWLLEIVWGFRNLL